MHGLWYERDWTDLIREAIIHILTSSLFIPAYKMKCISSIIIISLIMIQHMASLFVHPDGFLPSSFVIPGTF